MDIDALAQDHAGAQEADAAHHLARDPCRVALANQSRENDEPGGPECDQRVGTQAGHLLVPLPLEADDATQQQRRGEAQGRVDQVQEIGRHHSGPVRDVWAPKPKAPPSLPKEG